jgi:hypothetical protein
VLAGHLLLQKLEGLLVSVELATEALSLEGVVDVEAAKSGKLSLARSVLVFSRPHLVLHALGEHARHSAAAKAGSDMGAHSTTASESGQAR